MSPASYRAAPPRVKRPVHFTSSEDLPQLGGCHGLGSQARRGTSRVRWRFPRAGTFHLNLEGVSGRGHKPVAALSGSAGGFSRPALAASANGFPGLRTGAGCRGGLHLGTSRGGFRLGAGRRGRCAAGLGSWLDARLSTGCVAGIRRLGRVRGRRQPAA